MKIKLIVNKLFLVFGLTILTACSSPKEQVAATMAVQTIQARASGTAVVEQAVNDALTQAAPTATVTASPTATTIPTATNTLVPPTPTVSPPAILDKYLKNIRIVGVDTFDTVPNQSGASGVTEFAGGNSETSSFRPLSREFHVGEGILVNVKFTKGTHVAVELITGQRNTNNYQQFGVFFQGTESKFVHVIGKIGYDAPLDNKIMIAEDRWYSVLLAIGNDGELIFLLWNPLEPDKVLNYRQDAMKESDWILQFNVKWGTLSVDDVIEIEFDEVLE